MGLNLKRETDWAGTDLTVLKANSRCLGLKKP